MYVDPSGHMPEWVKWTLGIGIIALGVGVSIASGGIASALIAGSSSLWASIGIGAAAGAIGGAASGFAISVGTQGIVNGFENIDLSKAGTSALTGAISGAIAGGIFGGIRYALSTQKIANAVSGYNSAQSQMNSFYSMGAKNFVGMPFSGANIARTVGQAAASYNSAYVDLIVSGVNSTISNLAISGVYSGLQLGLKFGIESIFSIF